MHVDIRTYAARHPSVFLLPLLSSIAQLRLSSLFSSFSAFHQEETLLRSFFFSSAPGKGSFPADLRKERFHLFPSKLSSFPLPFFHVQEQKESSFPLSVFFRKSQTSPIVAAALLASPLPRFCPCYADL